MVHFSPLQEDQLIFLHRSRSVLWGFDKLACFGWHLISVTGSMQEVGARVAVLIHGADQGGWAWEYGRIQTSAPRGVKGVLEDLGGLNCPFLQLCAIDDQSVHRVLL